MKKPSTYSLLVRSEEKGRSLFETAVYALVVLSAIVSIGQFTLTTVTLPGDIAAKAPTSAATIAKAGLPGPGVARG
jgi:hypothetical protein